MTMETTTKIAATGCRCRRYCSTLALMPRQLPESQSPARSYGRRTASTGSIQLSPW